MAAKADTGKDSSDEIDERLTSALRRLIVRCRDSAAGYRKAAEEADDDSLRFEFEQMGDERSRLSEALDSIARELGIESSQDDGSGDAHRTFLGSRTKLLKGDPKAILEEVARGEATFERVFDDVLGLRMPRPARRRLQIGHRAVRQARDYYKSLARRMRRRRDGPAGIRFGRVGSRLGQNPLATVAVVAASALVLGTVATLSRRENFRPSMNKRRLRDLDKRLRKLEGRGERHLETYRVRGLQKQARRGLERLTRHFGGHR